MEALFKAFADPTRLRILSLLRRRGELCVCDLVATLKLGQSKISRHLAYLRKAGLVRDRKDGLWSHYSLAKPSSPLRRRMLRCLDDCFDEMGILKKDFASLKTSRTAGCR
jgi:ArsR family transcriptional regulator